MAGSKVVVDVEGRQLALSNLDKQLWPDGTSKGVYLDYISRIAPVLLPHLAGRPLTMKRYPEGALGHAFFEKNAPSHTPDWVRTVTLPAPGSTKAREEISYVVVEELATLVWAANLAALELHTPQWRVGPRGAARPPDQLVIDLDPGAPATVVECCQVALLLRPLLDDPVAKTSGSKGLQLYTRWSSGSAAGAGSPSDFARGLAEQLEREHPDLVVSRMAKVLRPRKVLVDWSQNNPAKTTVSVYSVRARDAATVSTPVTWDEVSACAHGDAPLSFSTADVLARVDAHGDLFAPLLSPA